MSQVEPTLTFHEFAAALRTQLDEIRIAYAKACEEDPEFCPERLTQKEWLEHVEVLIGVRPWV